MIPKRRKAGKMGCRAKGVVRCAAHLKWIRGFYCCVCSMTDAQSQPSPTEAAHVRLGTDGGMGMKPGDNWTIPLCSDHHREQHQIGEASFQERYQIESIPTAEKFWTNSPAGRKWRLHNE